MLFVVMVCLTVGLASHFNDSRHPDFLVTGLLPPEKSQEIQGRGTKISINMIDSICSLF
jgi:hypothetical protein